MLANATDDWMDGWTGCFLLCLVLIWLGCCCCCCPYFTVILFVWPSQAELGARIVCASECVCVCAISFIKSELAMEGTQAQCRRMVVRQNLVQRISFMCEHPAAVVAALASRLESMHWQSTQPLLISLSPFSYSDCQCARAFTSYAPLHKH